MALAPGVPRPTTTVIVATYNQPEVLELCLAGLAAQTDPDFDVIVADDGSTPPVAGRVERLSGELPFRVRVLSQPDQGFRKARIQNRAALETPASLLVFLDGDCIPFRDCIAAYRQRAVGRDFYPGAVTYLDREQTRRLTPERVWAGEHESGLRRREALRLWSVHLKNRLHSGGRLSRPRFKGGNFAIDAGLFREVDGFDEAYCGYGKEDSDLRNRLRNAGARGRSLWHVARVCHIAWDRPWGRGRDDPPPGLYEAGKQRVRARIGLSSHTVLRVSSAARS
ncbi:MAG: glycosyltransferase [Myxococcota bacterium]